MPPSSVCDIGVRGQTSSMRPGAKGVTPSSKMQAVVDHLLHTAVQAFRCDHALHTHMCWCKSHYCCAVHLLYCIPVMHMAHCSRHTRTIVVVRPETQAQASNSVAGSDYNALHFQLLIETMIKYAS